MRRRGAFLVVLALAIGLLAAVSGAAPGGNPGKPPVPVAGDGACDNDGVTTGWIGGFSEVLSPGGYGIHAVAVSGISSTCETAEVTVAVSDAAGTVLATGGPVVPGDSTSVTVPLATPARAEEITVVHVELEGGSIPIPDDCTAMAFDRVFTGETGPDTMTGSNHRDLVFALPGDDTAGGGNQSDCVDGGAGNDTLTGGNQDDVLLGGEGDDHLDGGTGRDRCIGGPGADTFATSCEVRTQ